MKAGLKTYFRHLAEDYEMGFAASILGGVLHGVSLFYSAAVRITQWFYAAKILPQKKLPIPVISVGNLTWGGAGKTPFVEYLARRVGENHKTSFILTRGYSHDEVEQLKNHLHKVEIGVGKDRFKAAQEMMKTRSADCAILDDGFQHWALHRDLNIVMINALNPFGNQHLIPRGIMREPLCALKRAQIIAISHANLAGKENLTALKQKIAQYAPDALVLESSMEALFFYRASNRMRMPITRLQGQRVSTFSAIGVPRSFHMLLSKLEIKPVRNFEFTDHHMYTEEELKEIQAVSKSARGEEIITTEKDFYRAPELIAKTIDPLVLAARVRISSGEEELTDKLFRLLGVKR